MHMETQIDLHKFREKPVGACAPVTLMPSLRGLLIRDEHSAGKKIALSFADEDE